MAFYRSREHMVVGMRLDAQLLSVPFKTASVLKELRARTVKYGGIFGSRGTKIILGLFCCNTQKSTVRPEFAKRW